MSVPVSGSRRGVYRNILLCADVWRTNGLSGLFAGERDNGEQLDGVKMVPDLFPSAPFLADSEEYTGGEPLFPGGGLPYPHSACTYDKQCKKYQIQKTDTDDNLYAALYFHSNSGRYDVGFPLSQIGVFKSSDCYAGRTG